MFGKKRKWQKGQPLARTSTKWPVIQVAGKKYREETEQGYGSAAQ